MPYCTRCGAQTSAVDVQCVSCGAPRLAYPGPPAPQAGPDALPQGKALTAVLVNVIVWPGLGSIFVGEKAGWGQGFLMLGGALLLYNGFDPVVPLALLVAAWAWSIKTCMWILRRATTQPQAPGATPR